MSLTDSTATSSIRTTYEARTSRSRELFARAVKAFPGGNTRQASYWEPYPLFIERASGTRLWDADGNEIIDLTYNYTAMVHGHAYPPIVEVVEIGRGTGWAANCSQMVDLAEQIVDRVPTIEQLRFTNSGTEAGLLALLIARVVTGRYKVLMARHGYHGSLMEFETGTFGRPGPATLLGEYNDLESFRKVLDEHGHEIAAVFIEPVMGAGGVVQASPEFLHGLRQAAKLVGAVFVLDEVITFRLGTGGVQKDLGLEPDLTMLGKLIGGGFPVGAVGGSRDLLGIFEPASMRAFHSGTYNGNPVTMAAGAVSVRELTAERIGELSRRAAHLQRGLEEAARRQGLPLVVQRAGSLLNLYFSARAPKSGMERDDLAILSRFHLAALNHGLMLAARGMAVTCTVMDEDTIGEIVERAGLAMADVANELD